MSAEVFNRDINPSQDFATTFPELKPLIHNVRIAEAFAVYEARAVKAKRLYQWLGSFGLLCTAIVMIAFCAGLTLGHQFPLLRALSFDAVVFAIGVAGLSSQVVLLLFGLKERWLVARYAAERLRCMKFQAFQVLGDASTDRSLAEKVEAFTIEQIVKLEQEIKGGANALFEFSPHEVVPSAARRSAEVPEIDKSARDVYDALRFLVQAQHFEARTRLHEVWARYPTVLAEFVFLIAAVSSVATFCAKLLLPETAPVLHWLYFWTLLLFVVSAVTPIYERGSTHREDAERYKRYAREVRRLRLIASRANSAEFLNAVDAMEILALQELYDFCRDAYHSNYIL